MIIVTGTIAYDYIMDFPAAFSEHILPEQIHNINLSFIVDKFAKRRGGTAGNVSYTLGLLQTPHILFSVAGKDFDEYKKAFIKLGISLDHVPVDKTNYTATGFAMTDKRENQIWGYYYGAAENNHKLHIKEVAGKNDLVLIGPAGAKGPVSFIHQCVKDDIPYMFDPGFSLTYISNDDLAFGVQHANYLIGNDYEMNIIKKRVAHAEEIFLQRIIITTFGENGTIISDHGKEYPVKRADADAVVDPTGAGDAWRAGFLAGIEKGFDLQTCGQIGSVAASFAIEAYGTQEHKYTKKKFEARHRQAYGSLIEL